MTYESLASRYRPKSFDEIVEQNVIKKTLKRQIERESFKHVVLFTGQAGSGKTSSARIFAREVNGGVSDFIELNAAVKNRVEDMRELVEDAQYMPIGTKYKVYIMDEVHLLTTQAQNALLKLFEEPPAHAVFILCTTDPQKLLDTILSRVERYDFKRISFQGIVSRLEYVLANEKNGENLSGVVSWETDALDCIAKAANGGMRNALTLLDKCLAYSGEVTLDNVVNVIGVVDYTQMFDLLEALQTKNNIKCSEIIEQLFQSGVDLKQFLKDFISFVIDVSKYCQTERFELLNEIPKSFENFLIQFKNLEFLRKVLSVFLKLLSDIKWENNPKMFIEAVILTEFC